MTAVGHRLGGDEEVFRSLSIQSGNPAATTAAELVHLQAHLVGDLHPEIAKRWRVLGVVGDVLAVFEATAGDEDGEVRGVVAGGVSHAGSEQDT